MNLIQFPIRLSARILLTLIFDLITCAVPALETREHLKIFLLLDN